MSVPVGKNSLGRIFLGLYSSPAAPGAVLGVLGPQDIGNGLAYLTLMLQAVFYILLTLFIILPISQTSLGSDLPLIPEGCDVRMGSLIGHLVESDRFLEELKKKRWVGTVPDLSAFSYYLSQSRIPIENLKLLKKARRLQVVNPGDIIGSELRHSPRTYLISNNFEQPERQLIPLSFQGEIPTEYGIWLVKTKNGQVFYSDYIKGEGFRLKAEMVNKALTDLLHSSPFLSPSDFHNIEEFELVHTHPSDSVVFHLPWAKPFTFVEPLSESDIYALTAFRENFVKQNSEVSQVKFSISALLAGTRSRAIKIKHVLPPPYQTNSITSLQYRQ